MGHAKLIYLRKTKSGTG